MKLIFLFVLIGLALAQLNPLNGIGYIGGGVDPLTYAKGQNIFDTSQMCNTPDNRWLIPCGMSATPILQTDITIESQTYSSNVDYTRDQYSDVKIDASASFLGFSASGSYSSSSDHYINTITQSYSSLVTAYVELQLYNLNSNKITMPLNPELLKYIAILHSKVLAGDDAGYQQWFIEFGSNFLPGVIAAGISGARLEQQNFVSNDYFHSTDINTVKNTASASFSYESVFNAGGSDNWGVTTTQIEEFTSSRTSYIVQAIGGMMDPSMTVAQWEQSAYANPALLSYEIDLSLFWLEPEVLCPLGNFSADIITKIRNDYINAYAPYLKINSINGCTNQYGKNFLLNYTVDDGSCNYDYPINSFFGDAYEYVQMYNSQGSIVSTTVTRNNIFTGTTSCPIWSNPHCQMFEYPEMYTCGGMCWLLQKKQCCYLAIAHMNYCTCDGATTPAGPAFGGYFSSGVVNPITQTYGCPEGFSNVDNICLGNAAPSATYGGRYMLLNGECFAPNPYTSQCNCPSTAPQAEYYRTQGCPTWSWYEYICLAPPEFLVGVNVGARPTLIPPNLSLSNSSSPSPSAKPTPSAKPAHHHHHVTHYINWPALIVIIAMSCCILLAICAVGIWWYRRYYRLGSYQRIQ